MSTILLVFSPPNAYFQAGCFDSTSIQDDPQLKEYTLRLHQMQGTHKHWTRLAEHLSSGSLQFVNIAFVPHTWPVPTHHTCIYYAVKRSALSRGSLGARSCAPRNDSDERAHAGGERSTCGTRAPLKRSQSASFSHRFGAHGSSYSSR